MKGFIEVTQPNGAKTLIAVNAIKLVDNVTDDVLIALDFSTTKKSALSGYVFVTETYSEVVEKIKAAQ